MRFDSPIPFGRFLLTERIGFGGTAEIFKAVRRGRSPGEGPVAIKRLLPHVAEDRHIVRLLQREVEALQRIDHPNVVRLLDDGEVRGLPYLVMELVDGVTLRMLLAKEELGPRVLPAAIALSIAAEIAAGLGEAWRHGVVHRDISPTNIQLTAAGDVKILDFGLARVRGMVQTTAGKGLKGKWAYLSPEQIDGQPLDGRSDLFALGSVLYQLLIGVPPFRGAHREETLRKIREHDFVPLEDAVARADAQMLPAAEWMPAIAPADVATLVSALLSHDRHDRPSDGDAVALRCRDLLKDTVHDHRYRSWLADEVRRASPPAGTWTGDAAELRGEAVTDPVGETVTAVGAEAR